MFPPRRNDFKCTQSLSDQALAKTLQQGKETQTATVGRVLTEDVYKNLKYEISKHSDRLPPMLHIVNNMKMIVTSFDRHSSDLLKVELNNKTDALKEYVLRNTMTYMADFEWLLKVRSVVEANEQYPRSSCLQWRRMLITEKLYLQTTEEKKNNVLKVLRKCLEFPTIADQFYDSTTEKMRNVMEQVESLLWPGRETTAQKKQRMARNSRKPLLTPPPLSLLLSAHCERSLRAHEATWELCKSSMMVDFKENSEALAKLEMEMESEEVTSKIISKQVERIYRLELAEVMKREKELHQILRQQFSEVRAYDNEVLAFHIDWLNQLSETGKITTSKYPAVRWYAPIRVAHKIDDELSAKLEMESEKVVSLMKKLEVSRKEGRKKIAMRMAELSAQSAISAAEKKKKMRLRRKFKRRPTEDE